MVDLRKIREALDAGDWSRLHELLDDQTVLRMVAVCEAAIALGTEPRTVIDGENLNKVFAERLKLRQVFNAAVRALEDSR